MVESLFSTLELRDVEVSNRVMVSPMCQYSATDGFANDWHRVHLGSRAVGGAGIVMSEATAVVPEGRITPQCLGIWNDEQAAELADITAFIESHGSIPAIQLAHAGRKASTRRPWEGRGPIAPADGGWEVVAPSEEPWPREEDPVPLQKLSTEGIQGVIESFAAAAERARNAGFEIAEIHGAHGYLLHEFLSPVANHRTDEYGGDFESRTRLIREVTEAVREVWPDDKPVFVRISATDWLSDRESWTLEDSVRLAPLLQDAGADLIDVSSGGMHPDQELPSTGPGYQVVLAETIREETDVQVGAVGGITAPQHADALIRNERADLAILGREFLRNPYWPLHAANTLGVDVEWPPQYRRAKPE